MKLLDVLRRHFGLSLRMGFGLSFLILILLFAEPTGTSFTVGGLVGAIGEAVRIWAAGFIHKGSLLSVAGPYALTRNPLYLGSFLIGCGLSIMSNNLYLFAIYLVGFGLIYTNVMRAEEEFLEREFGHKFIEYTRSVPLFVPNLSNRGTSDPGNSAFSWRQALSSKGNRETEVATGFLACSGLLYWMVHLDDPTTLKVGLLTFFLVFLVGRWIYRLSKSRNMGQPANADSGTGID